MKAILPKTILATLVLSLLGAGLALASGSSGGAPGAGASYGEQNPHLVTETIECVVTKVFDNGTIFVRDGEDQPEHALPYSKKTKFVAQSKKDFDGRKKLKVADLKVGQKLKVTMIPASKEIVRVKVLKQG